MLKNFDLEIFQYINSLALQSPLWDRVVVYGNEYGLYVFAGIVAVFFFTSRRLFWRIAGSVAIARGVFTEAIRALYQRPRPFVNEELENVRQLVQKNVANDSFPSGHAAFYFAIAFAVYFWNKQAGITLLVLAAVLSLARVYAGIHYPSDILGGAVIGFISAWIVDKIMGRYR